MQTKPLLLLLSTVCLVFPVLGAIDNGSVQPNAPTVGPGQQQQFKLLGYTSDVTWSVQPVGMGTITQTGLYTAPSTGRVSTGLAFIYAQPFASDAYYTIVYLAPSSSAPAPAVPP